MATKTTNTSAAGASGATPKKKTGSRRMKKQVRRTLGGLFLASAIAIAAIPVEPTSAKGGTVERSTDPLIATSEHTYQTNIIRAIHYQGSNIATDPYNSQNGYEVIPGVNDDTTKDYSNLQIKVPFIRSDENIYEDETGKFNFAYIKESAESSEWVAVLVGISGSAISSSGALTIPNDVDAYLDYVSSSTQGDPCAVNKNGDFLYYKDSTQIENGDGKKWTAQYYPQRASTALSNGKVNPSAANDFGGFDETAAYVDPPQVVWDKKDIAYLDYVPSTLGPNDRVIGNVPAGAQAFKKTYDIFINDPVGEKNDDGTFKGTWQVQTVYYPLIPEYQDTMVPCYRKTLDTADTWIDKELFYWKGTGTIELTNMDDFETIVGKGDSYQRIHDASIRYIGMQKTKSIPAVDDNGQPIMEAGTNKQATILSVTDPTTYVEGGQLKETPSNGVLANNKNLWHLTVGENLFGIGDYAFYGCTALSDITVSSYLNSIGNGAFKGCIGLTRIDIPSIANLGIVGASAFEDCTSLTSFNVPKGTSAIGDRAFKNCPAMTSIDMCGNAFPEGLTKTVSLKTIGYNAFMGDSGLTSLEFPDTLSQKIPVHYLYGCTGLQYVKANNQIFDIIDGDPMDYTGGTYSDTEEMGTFHNYRTDPAIKTCDIDDWIALLKDENFYFEANDRTELHKTAQDHAAAFLYDDGEWAGDYEIVLECEEEPTHHKNKFIVDTNNNLVSVELDEQCTEITIPAHVGKCGVSNLARGSFNNNCSLKKLYIPASVQSIESRAFAGCHNLNTVVFTDPYNYDLTIGAGAFDTQAEVGAHGTYCPTKPDLSPTPELNFVGPIEGNYAPFAYAMDGGNNINVGEQPTTYITYYSGWPTFLQVKYNPDRASTEDENELIAYPTKDYLGKMNDAYVTNPTQALKDYPFMSADDFANLAKVMKDDNNKSAWDNRDPKTGAYSGSYTQDQVTCADSIFHLQVPYGVESLKEGLFSNLKADATQVTATPATIGNSALGANVILQSIDLQSVKTIDPYAFAGLTALESVNIVGTQTIGDYAFYGDKSLVDVSISGETTKLGTRPFRACSKLTDVDFTGSNFICEDSIIYGTSGGAKTSVVECLETRGQGTSNTVVAAKEMTGITAMQDEAFMDCDDVETINLSESELGIVPERAFAATNGLYLVELPATVKTIKRDAFLDSNVKQVSIPGMNTNIQDEYVFSQTQYKDKDHDDNPSDFYQGYHSEETTQKTDVEKDEIKNSRYNPYVEATRTGKVTFNTPAGSFAEQYADDHEYIQATPAAVKYKVTFKDPENEGDAQILEVQEVGSGECAQIPRGWNPNAHSGKTFLGWESSADDNVYSDTEVPTVPITETTTYKARYSGGACTVTFYDKDGNVIVTKEVTYGNDVSAPEAPKVEGYTFKGWDRFPVSSEGLTNIVEDTTFKAQYEKVDSSDKHHVVFYNYDDTPVSDQYVADGDAAITPASPSRAGYTFTGWKPADFTNVTKDMDIYAQFEKNANGNGGNGGSSSGNSNGNNNNGSNGSSSGNSSGKTYTVTVINGSGSGTYTEGSTVVIAANDPAKDKAFDKWTTADVTLASTTLSATTFKMPGKNVTVTANYKDAKSTSSNAVRYATGNASRPPATGSTAMGHTQVQVNKGGVSNVDLASATVRGSTDSFIVKVTETNEATNLVENALNNRYGGLDALKYWPCDISLYDSTGTTKITDTTGLSVEITLPIPDELRQYGGNNKVAAVSNNQLEELSTRFNTVNGTPTVTFTATHFSPYVIYTDTNNLVASEMLDASPKTGDPIHPKWFLAIALFAGSIFMFLKKDKKPIPATV